MTIYKSRAESLFVPEISIIVPVYNGEKYVKNCIDMLLAEEGDNFEIIIINDGSTDNTDEEIQSFLPNERIVYFKQENKGASAARNKGLDICRGDWIVFVDVDDEILPGYIKDISETIREYPDVNLYLYARPQSNTKESYKKIINGEKVFSATIVTHYHENRFPDESDYFICSVWSKVFRRKLIDTENIRFDTMLTLDEDTLFLCEVLSKSNEVLFVHKGFYNYLHHDESAVSVGGKEEDKAGFERFVNVLFEYMENLYTPDFWNELGSERIANFILWKAECNVERVARGTKDKPLRYRAKIIKEMAVFTYDSIGRIQKDYFRNFLKKDAKRRKMKFRLIKICAPLYIIMFDMANGGKKSKH